MLLQSRFRLLLPLLLRSVCLLCLSVSLIPQSLACNLAYSQRNMPSASASFPLFPSCALCVSLCLSLGNCFALLFPSLLNSLTPSLRAALALSRPPINRFQEALWVPSLVLCVWTERSCGPATAWQQQEQRDIEVAYC